MERYVYDDLFHCILYDSLSNISYSEFAIEFRDNGRAENDTFSIHEYNWSDEGSNDLDKDPCFYHKPSGFKMTWYKYPLRAVESNMDITIKQFADILYDCKNSLSEHVKYEVGNSKWWENDRNTI